MFKRRLGCNVQKTVGMEWFKTLGVERPKERLVLFDHVERCEERIPRCCVHVDKLSMERLHVARTFARHMC